MNRFNLDVKYIRSSPLSNIDKHVIEEMWKLFLKIAETWSSHSNVSQMSTNFLVFMSNRIKIDPNYLNEYVNASDVIQELIQQYGNEKDAYHFLFTDSGINNGPPVTRIAKARQLVSNEFIQLYLSLGGFKLFGTEINYPGFFGGANIAGKPPYRSYKK